MLAALYHIAQPSEFRTSLEYVRPKVVEGLRRLSFMP